jgi:hypothetical protein
MVGSTALGQIGMVAALETEDSAVREGALARIADEYTTPEAQLCEALDGRSDFWRAVGDRDRARAVLDDWVDELPRGPLGQTPGR